MTLTKSVVMDVPKARLPYGKYIDPKNRKLDWTVILSIGALHIVCFLAPFTFTWSGFALFLFLWIFKGFGITGGYHRLLTHKSFETPRWVTAIFTFVGTLNWQGGPIRWVKTHRNHHRYADQPEDPHTPLHFFGWAHAWWTMLKDHPEEPPSRMMSDLENDPMMQWFEKWFWLPLVVFAIILVAIGYFVGGWQLALSWFVWGVALRTVFMYHSTWFVNSATHTWGSRVHDTKDKSTNLWWVAWVSNGEGWHHNHHAYEQSPRHGFKWWQIDLTWYLIKFLAWIGLAWNLKLPPKAVLDR